MSLEYGSTEFVGYEAAGLQAAATAGFVLVAGGIGERLGYNGIKVGALLVPWRWGARARLYSCKAGMPYMILL